MKTKRKRDPYTAFLEYAVFIESAFIFGFCLIWLSSKICAVNAAYCNIIE
jgi:hypothetical protein